MRESLDFYRSLVVGGVYEFAGPVETPTPSTFAPALRRCIDQHPHLSTIIVESDTKTPRYKFCPRLELSQHVEIFTRNEAANTDVEAVKRVLATILDAKWPFSIPPWKIVVLPLSVRKCFIGFSFSHGLGDGVSALAFHSTFLKALQEQGLGLREGESLIHTIQRRPLSPAFDTKNNLPISWSFLLAPLLATYLPKSLGFEANVVNPSTWVGSPIFYSSEKYQTCVEIISIDADTVAKALRTCRVYGAKLTGLLHQFIIEALSKLLPSRFDQFIAQTAIDLRNAVGVSKDEMGLFVAGNVTVLDKTDKTGAEKPSFGVATSMTSKLGAASGRLHDQSVGLLRYLSDIRAWTLSKVGGSRDTSYEISNLTTFKPAKSAEAPSIQEMVFAQPTNITGSPLQFNVVSVKDGPMNITVTWQPGALGLGNDDEVDFVDRLCRRVEGSFVNLTTAGS